MIEEGRDVPRDMRRWLLVSVLEGDLLQGSKGHAYKVARSDIEELALAGLLRPQGQYDYVITPAGQRFYAECRSNEAEPAKSAEQEVKGFLDGVAFAAAYPGAHAIWAQAQALRWSADSEAELTTVGHKARETMQIFATEAVERYRPTDVDNDPSKVNRRLGAVIAMRLATIGEGRAALLKALGDYSEATMDLIQRQEHGAQKEGRPLNWHDARRVVLSVAMVMFELSAVLDTGDLYGET